MSTPILRPVDLLGNAPGGEVSVGALSVVTVSLASLSIFLLPLIALLLGHDAIVGEAERGTLMLTLSYPVTRGQFLMGKFLGHMGIIGFAVLMGYGAAALVVGLRSGAPGTDAITAFAALVGSALLMSAIFLALGYISSVLVKERATAIGLAIGIWLIFVIIYDLLFLGLLVLAGENLPSWLVTGLFFLNPADLFRLLNLTSTEAMALASGMGSAGTDIGHELLVLVMMLWLVAGLGGCWLIFRRKEL